MHRDTMPMNEIPVKFIFSLIFEVCAFGAPALEHPSVVGFFRAGCKMVWTD